MGGMSWVRGAGMQEKVGRWSIDGKSDWSKKGKPSQDWWGVLKRGWGKR